MVESTNHNLNSARTDRSSHAARLPSLLASCAHSVARSFSQPFLQQLARHVNRQAVLSVAFGVVLATVLPSDAMAIGNATIGANQSAARTDAIAQAESDPTSESESGTDAGTSTGNVQTLQFVSAGAIADSDTFDTDLSKSDLLEAKDRAWQYRPYRVAVWLCLDGSPELSSVSDRLKNRLLAHAELIDPSGWDLAVDAAPRQWRWHLLENISNTDLIGGFQTEPTLQDYDKLMVVTLSCPDGTTRARVREYDMLTGQWGALVSRDLAQRDRLSASVMEMFRNAFMPLARIDRVTEKEGARLLPRALQACVVNKRVDLESFEAVENTQSPVFIRKEDRFLPVIRRTDRKGNLKKLDPIEFTFLTVRETSTLEIMCDVHSSQRGPLAQRKSKRSQKLALVIRAPEQPTKLTLVSREKDAAPIPGIEIWSRRIGMTKEDASEYIGKTDWQGSIVIPPDDNRLRLVYLKRGSRALKKLPIVPGLYASVTSSVPNDTVRLFSQGVITGFQNDITSLVIQRRVFEEDIDAAIEKKDLDTAKQILRDYQELDTPQNIRSRMTDEQVRLESLTTDKREVDHIRKMFENLNEVVSAEINKSRESELQARVQQLSGGR